MAAAGRGSSDLSRKLHRGCATTSDIEVQSDGPLLNGECAVSFVRKWATPPVFLCTHPLDIRSLMSFFVAIFTLGDEQGFNVYYVLYGSSSRSYRALRTRLVTSSHKKYRCVGQLPMPWRGWNQFCTVIDSWSHNFDQIVCLFPVSMATVIVWRVYLKEGQIHCIRCFILNN